MEQDKLTIEQQEKPEAYYDRSKNVEGGKNRISAEKEATKEGNAGTLPSSPDASTGLSTGQLKARIGDQVSRVEHRQEAIKQEKVEDELPREPSVQDGIDPQVTDPASHANTTASLRSHVQTDPSTSGQSTQLSFYTAATASHPASHIGAGSQANAAANVQTNIIRPPNPNPSEGASFHRELPTVVWVNGRWCELACPDPSCKTNGPVNKKNFFIDISALRDHVIRSHKGIAKLSLTIPAERRTFLQSCVQRSFDAADIQRLSEGRDPIGGPIKKRQTIRDAESMKATQARHGSQNRSTPTVSGGDVDASSADNSAIELQNSMNTVSGQSNPIDGKVIGDVSISSYSERSGQPIIVRSWEDFDAYMAASQGSNLTTSYSDQSGPHITLRSWDDLDAYMAAFKRSNLTNGRITLGSNRASQTAPGLSATARLERGSIQTLTGIMDEHNGTPSFSVDVNRFRDSRGARVQNSEDGESQRSGDEAEETLENEVK